MFWKTAISYPLAKQVCVFKLLHTTLKSPAFSLFEWTSVGSSPCLLSSGTVLQMQPHHCWMEGKHHCIQPSGCAIVSVVQYAFCFHCCNSALLSHLQLVPHQNHTGEKKTLLPSVLSLLEKASVRHSAPAMQVLSKSLQFQCHSSATAHRFFIFPLCFSCWACSGIGTRDALHQGRVRDHPLLPGALLASSHACSSAYPRVLLSIPQQTSFRALLARLASPLAKMLLPDLAAWSGSGCHRLSVV